MKKCLLLAVFVVILLTAFAFSDDPKLLGPGAIRIVGSISQLHRLSLEVAIHQVDLKMPYIYGVIIYSEPSHSLLCSILDTDIPDKAKMDIKAEKPDSMIVTTIRDQIEPNFEIPAPPPEDNRILVQYVLKSEDGTIVHTVRDVYIPHGLSSFGFISGARFEAFPDSWTTSCYCDERFCKTITCGTDEMTLCCPSCLCSCGHVECPK